MHEFSISSEIANSVLDAAGKNKGKKVLSIQLEIGELTHLNGEQVAFWVHELFKGSVAEGAEVKIKTTKVRIHCKTCGYRGGMKSNQEDFFRHLMPLTCPRCNGIQIRAVKGRECILRRIQVIK
ncbi:MAG: hydrogenase maturation nickel metallochaperone HypA [Syntrophaceae bacterium]|nr:hydrogenase maturation nickel metallochaperone HypA [Syntrophaceae bacterium]